MVTVPALPGTEARARSRVLKEMTATWREQIARGAHARDALAVELRALCQVYNEADRLDPGKTAPLGLELQGR